MKSMIQKIATIVAGLALVITSCAVNSACYYFMYQPELPEGADRLRRR